MPLSKTSLFTDPYLRHKLYQKILNSKVGSTLPGKWSPQKSKLLNERYIAQGGRFNKIKVSSKRKAKTSKSK